MCFRELHCFRDCPRQESEVKVKSSLYVSLSSSLSSSADILLEFINKIWNKTVFPSQSSRTSLCSIYQPWRNFGHVIYSFLLLSTCFTVLFDKLGKWGRLSAFERVVCSYGDQKLWYMPLFGLPHPLQWSSPIRVEPWSVAYIMLPKYYLWRGFCLRHLVLWLLAFHHKCQRATKIHHLSRITACNAKATPM